MKKYVLLVIALGVMLTLIAACAPAPTPTPVPKPTEPPKPTVAPTTVPTKAPEPTKVPEPTKPPAVLDGAALLQERCTVCHNLDRVKSASKTKDQWLATVDRMISKGAKLNDAEKAVLVDYLAKTYAAAAAPTQPPAATATPPPPKCEKLPNMPIVKAGELGSPEKPIVITFVPSGDVPTITKAGNETAECLSKITGLSYKIEVGTSYAVSIEAMGAGKAHAGFLATFAAILAREKYGIEPALASTRAYATNDLDPDKGLKGQQTDFYKGQFITRKGSGIKTVADLKGKTFCGVDAASTSGWIIPSINLKANGIDPQKDLKAVTFAGSHDNVVIAVYKGDCDAGATYVDARDSAAVQKAYPDVKDKVEPFFVSIRIPNDGLQFIKGLDPKLRDATVDGLLAMMADPGGKAVVKRAYTYDSLKKVPVTFYDEFRDLLKKAGVDAATLVK